MKYDDATTKNLVDLWSGLGANPEQISTIAKQLGATDRSVIAKLSQLGLYQRQPYKDKQGNPPQSKAQLVEAIALVLEKDPELLESLEKANKWVLKLLLDNLQ